VKLPYSYHACDATQTAVSWKSGSWKSGSCGGCRWCEVLASVCCRWL